MLTLPPLKTLINISITFVQTESFGCTIHCIPFCSVNEILKCFGFHKMPAMFVLLWTWCHQNQNFSVSFTSNDSAVKPKYFKTLKEHSFFK